MDTPWYVLVSTGLMLGSGFEWPFIIALVVSMIIWTGIEDANN